MTWLKNLTLGAAAFLAAHAVEVSRWRQWFDPSGAHQPWFLNTGSAAAFTAASVAIAGAVGASLWAMTPQKARQQSLALAAGAALALAITLWAIGPGSIFPVVIVAGAGFLTLSAGLGSWLGFLAGAAIRSRLDRPEPP
jgi:hypothetical protein